MSRSDLKPPGTAPGTLVHIGDRRTDFGIDIVEFEEDRIEKFKTTKPSDCQRFHATKAVTWIHVTGLHKTERIGELAEILGIDSLVAEDILNTNQRTKLEEHPDYLFIIADLPTEEDSTESEDPELQHQAVDHFALLLTEYGVITFCEDRTTAFDRVRERLNRPDGRLRRRGADYLAWALLDSMVDHFLEAVEHLEQGLDRLEEELDGGNRTIDGGEIYRARQNASHLYRVVRPLREVTGGLLRSESDLLAATTQNYLRDLYDHALHALESSENLREHASALRDFYMTLSDKRLNEVMKVLTCISTIFLPLSFLAGVYGMNFEFMPELAQKWGYPILWVLFLTVAGGLLMFFRKKRWL